MGVRGVRVRGGPLSCLMLNDSAEGTVHNMGSDNFGNGLLDGLPTYLLNGLTFLTSISRRAARFRGETVLRSIFHF